MIFRTLSSWQRAEEYNETQRLLSAVRLQMMFTQTAGACESESKLIADISHTLKKN